MNATALRVQRSITMKQTRLAALAFAALLTLFLEVTVSANGGPAPLPAPRAGGVAPAGLGTPVSIPGPRAIGTSVQVMPDPLPPRVVSGPSTTVSVMPVGRIAPDIPVQSLPYVMPPLRYGGIPAYGWPPYVYPSPRVLVVVT
jgi:hypothetical protein